MKEKYENFCKALDRLKEALTVEPTGLNLDAAIQRFEFTYELSWNLLKKHLYQEGIECHTPRECFSRAFQNGIIEDEELWLKMIGDRNLSSHLYDEEEAKRIYQQIKTKYFALFEKLKKKMA